MPITIADAKRIASRLSEIPQVLAVEIFGSVARRGESRNDLDLILIVNEDEARSFVLELREAKTIYFGSSEERRLAAKRVLGSLFARTLDQISIPVDIFLFPRHWRTRLKQLQRALPHEDPHFMQNIAEDARSL